ncbi:MAG: rhomboid family intramembrane serine protease [Planctomycetota bacterium]
MAASVCGRCGALVKKSQKRCGNCGRQYPALFGLRPILDRIFPLRARFTMPLVMALVVIYLVTVLVSRKLGDIPGGGLNAFSPGGDTLVNYFGAYYLAPILGRGEWWRLVTACFLHGSVMHILFNGYALYQLGPLIEAVYGPARFTVLFVLTGIGGYLASLPFVSLSVGASGALFGLIGAAIAFGKRRGGTHGKMLRDVAIRWLVYGLAFGFLVPGINNYAHAGGALSGFGIAWFFDIYQVQRGRESDSARIGALACLLVVLVSVGFALHLALLVLAER